MPVKKNKALCIGVNYAGTEYELRGCLNDAEDWGALLIENKFAVTSLLEQDATKENIVNSVNSLIKGLKKNDVAAITYSGHGTWIPDRDGDEPDGRDEAICPFDMGDDGHNLIIGPEFKEMFNFIPKGARVIFVTDSCFSGTVYRFFNGASSNRKVRFIPPSHILKKQDLMHRMDLGFGQQVNSKVNKIKPPLPGLIHYSGCGDNEYSCDAHLDGRFNGAMSYYAVRAFREVLKVSGTYHEAWLLLRKSLPSWEFQQTPLLNAMLGLKNMRVLS